MQEQEMQFANPDWQPPAQLSAGPAELEPPAPLPVNAARLGWLNEENEPFAASELASQHEQRPQPAFLPAYQQTPIYQGSLAVRPRSRRPWLWAIAFVLLVWLIPMLFFFPMRHSGGFSLGKSGPSAPYPVHMDAQPYSYDMANISTLNINDPNGYIHVHANGSVTEAQIEVQSVDSKSKPVEFVPGKDGSLTIQVNAPPDNGPVLLDITLPQKMALNLSAISGDIEIDGMSGQFNLKTDAMIILNNDTISGQSNLSSAQAGVKISNSSLSGRYIINSNGHIELSQVNMSDHALVQAQGAGDIHMDGTLDPQGTYAFTTDSGFIDLTLPSNTAAQFTLDPGNGSSSNDFSTTNGSAPQAQVTLKTSNGDIHVHKAP